MATIKIPSAKNAGGNYRNKRAVKNLINYIWSKEKMPHNIIGALGVSLESSDLAIQQFLEIQQYYRKRKGKRIFHLIVSFSEEEMKRFILQDYRQIGYYISRYFDNQYQVIFALHEDQPNYHIHFAINTVNYSTGKKLVWRNKDLDNIKKIVNQFL